jgi:hypothetical protein
MKTMTWVQRICIGSGLALASVFTVPAVAGAADPGCYTACTTPSTVLNNTVTPPAPPNTQAVAASATLANGSSSLPFTGADVGELAAFGAGAIVIGGLLARRRRSAS